MLLNAYLEIGNLVESSEHFDTNDDEEDIARKEFKANNYERVNKTSGTMKISTSHVNG